jgi:hypothetical protein
MKHLSVLVAVAGTLAGCYGPISSTMDVLDAEAQIQTAEKAGAKEKAIYEWTAATRYLHKAREEVGYSNFQAGVDFAEKASLCANAAVLISLNENQTAAETAREQCRPKYEGDEEKKREAATRRIEGSIP